MALPDITSIGLSYSLFVSVENEWGQPSVCPISCTAVVRCGSSVGGTKSGIATEPPSTTAHRLLAGNVVGDVSVSHGTLQKKPEVARPPLLWLSSTARIPLSVLTGFEALISSTQSNSLSLAMTTVCLAVNTGV